MKPFEKEIKRRLIILLVYAVVIIAGLTVVIILKNTGNTNEDLLSPGTLIGFAGGSFIMLFKRIKTYCSALKNPKFLETLQIRETDERNRIIALKAGRTTLYAVSVLLSVTVIVSSFINKTVFFTAGTILILLLVLYIFMRFYYSRKY